jgi:hypothetical protein
MTTRIAYFLIDAAEVAATFRALLAVFTDEVLNAYLENVNDPDGIKIADDIAHPTAVDLPEHWPQGRLFTHQADLRWERTRNGGLHAVLITDADLPTRAREPLELTLVGGEDHTQRVLLWGEYRRSAWREERIPRLNSDQSVYPATWSGPYAAIITREYEAPLPAQRPKFAGVRSVVRYLAYDGNVQFAESVAESTEEDQD